VHVADGALDLEAERRGALLAHGLHRRAAIDGMHVQRRLALEQGNADGVGAGTDVEHLLLRLQFHQLHEAAQEVAELAERGDVVGAVVIGRDVGEDVIQVVAPDIAKACFAYGLARSRWGWCH
jgi:hypothetical protein